MKVRKLSVVFALSMLLAACGGGGGDGSAPAATANAFDSMIGTYTTGCVVLGTQQSRQFTLTISNPVGADKVSGTATSKDYFSNNSCDENALDKSFSVSGEATALAATKNIAGSLFEPKTGMAKTAEFTFSALTISKGTFNGTIPIPGTKTPIGYLLEGNKLYVLSGSREADGLPATFSKKVLTKQ
jgi:hypothetical protein